MLSEGVHWGCTHPASAAAIFEFHQHRPVIHSRSPIFSAPYSSLESPEFSAQCTWPHSFDIVRTSRTVRRTRLSARIIIEAIRCHDVLPARGPSPPLALRNSSGLVPPFIGDRLTDLLSSETYNHHNDSILRIRPFPSSAGRVGRVLGFYDQDVHPVLYRTGILAEGVSAHSGGTHSSSTRLQ